MSYLLTFVAGFMFCLGVILGLIGKSGSAIDFFGLTAIVLVFAWMNKKEAE